jgi:hypothetical protein
MRFQFNLNQVAIWALKLTKRDDVARPALDNEATPPRPENESILGARREQTAAKANSVQCLLHGRTTVEERLEILGAFFALLVPFCHLGLPAVWSVRSPQSD